VGWSALVGEIRPGRPAWVKGKKETEMTITIELTLAEIVMLQFGLQALGRDSDFSYPEGRDFQRGVFDKLATARKAEVARHYRAVTGPEPHCDYCDRWDEGGWSEPHDFSAHLAR
jgi:hypothetical protein